MTSPKRHGGGFRDFLSGVALLGRGLGMYATNPGLLLIGLIPALIAGLLLIAVLVVLIIFIGTIASDVTWFADSWPEALRDLVRVIAGVSIVGLTGLLAIVTFTSITLAVGEPFYEKISERVEERFGGVPAMVELPWHTELIRGIGESLRLIAASAVIGVPLFVLGLIPAVGQTVVPVIGALVGGWFLAVELTGIAFARRGLRLIDRRRILRAHRPLTLGFGAAVFVCFLVPLGAVLVMPAAVAGATMLARRVLAEGESASADQPTETKMI